jgi:hypothetical protein
MPSQNLEQQNSNLPDLPAAPAMDFDARDVKVPRIKLAQPQQQIVINGEVPAFSVYTTYGAEDDDPQVVVESSGGDKPDFEANPDHGLLLHVLSMYKTWSASVDEVTGEIDKDNGEFRTWSFNDPSRHPEADLVYNYMVACPELDEGQYTPFKLLLTRTSTPAARDINTLLQRSEQPAYALAFRFWGIKREGGKGRQKFTWVVAKVRPVQAKPEHVQLAASMVAAATPPAEQLPQLGAGAEREELPAI